MIRLRIVTLLIVVAVTACQKADNGQALESDTATEPTAAVIATRAIDNALFIALPNDKEQKITLESREFTHKVSPDGRWICIDQALFSNLQVTSLYKRRDDGSFVLSKTGNLSKLGWQEFSQEKSIALEDLENTRSRCTGWHQHASIVELELTGVGADGEAIDTKVQIRLEE